MTTSARFPWRYLSLFFACIAITVSFCNRLYAEEPPSVKTPTKPASLKQAINDAADDESWDREREPALRYAIETHSHSTGIKVLSFKCKDGGCTLKFIDYTKGKDWALIERDLQKHPLYGERRSGGGSGRALPDGTREFTTFWSKYSHSQSNADVDLEQLAEFRRNAARAATLEESYAFFKAEEIDAAWSLNMNSLLQSFISNHEYGHYADIHSIECRQVSCALIIDVKTQEEDGEFYWNVLWNDLMHEFRPTLPSGFSGPIDNFNQLGEKVYVRILSNSDFRQRATASLERNQSK